MDTDKSYFVYVLWSMRRSCFYIGSTEDVAKRLNDHNTGISKWTKGKGPWDVVFQRNFSSLGEARKFENLLKRQKGGEKFYELTGLNSADYIRQGSLE